MASNGNPRPKIVDEPATLGLSLIANPEHPNLDVVFVHGFNGHPERTWLHRGDANSQSSDSSRDYSDERPRKIQKAFDSFKASRSRTSRDRKGVYWPRDLLPESLPYARVLAYGYDAHLGHRLGPSHSQKSVYDFAKDFLLELEAVRRSHPKRPLVFIAHSLGGIVVKEMLRQSYGHLDHQTELRAISESTAGIIFFGTPHGGADPQSLLKTIAENVAWAVGVTFNKQVVESLLPSSERLRQLRDEIGPMARTRGWIIHCFQEDHGITALNGRKVVEDISSCLGDASLELTQHIADDHMGMCRFNSFHDAEYQKVVAAINRILPEHNGLSVPTRTAFNNAERQAYINSLRFDQIDARHASIKSAHSKTGKWLLKKSEYLDWLAPERQDEHNGFLWIKGKAGSGKSTMLKYILSHINKTILGTPVISFFFNARGHIMERSTIGMYRSLLLQLFEHVPELQSALDVLPRPPLSATGEFEGEWQLETLVGIFQDAVRAIGERGLICIVDALDECHEDDVRRMVACFENLGKEASESGLQVRICFSSRHYPYITVDRCIELVLEGQEGHQQDLANYLQSELKIGKSQRCEKIKEQLLRRTNGIFLWLVLVVQILQKEFDRGRVHALENRLEEIPPGLDELFRDILTRDTRNADDLLLCLQWILFAKRPLRREELYFAILAGTEPQHLGPWDAAEVTPTVMDRFILDCSKGLTALTRTKNQTVQFIHESVRDYLLKGNGLAHIRQDLLANFSGLSHERLKLCCQNYLAIGIPELEPIHATIEAGVGGPEQQPGNESDDVGEIISCDNGDHEMSAVTRNQDSKQLREILCSRYPFLDYAVNHVFNHAEAALVTGILQEVFIYQFNLAAWTSRNNVLQKFKTRRYSPSVTLLYIFAEKNLPALIRDELSRVPHMDLRGERFVCPLRAAIAHKNEAAIQAFLEPADRDRDARYPSIPTASQDGRRPDSVSVLLQCKAELLSSAKEWSVFLWAVLRGEVGLMNDLLATGKVVIHCQVTTPHYGIIAEISQKSTDAHLMPSGISLEILSRSDDSRAYFHELLPWAMRHGYQLLFRHLIWHYVAILRDFSVPSRSRILSDVRLLLTDRELTTLLCQRTDLEGNLKVKAWGVLLSVGFQYQVPCLVKHIVQHNPLSLDHVPVEAIYDFLVQYVAQRDFDTLRLVIAEANGNTTFQTRLLRLLICRTYPAPSIGAISRILMANGFEFNGAAIQGVPLLSWASKAEQDELVQLILERCSVDVNARDSEGQTALSLAAFSGSLTTMKMLLDAGADANCQDKQGAAPLSYAASTGHEEKVELLLKTTHINVNVQDNGGDTPLLRAVRGMAVAKVALLLEHQDVDVNIRDKDGDTALLGAVALRDESVASLLLKRDGVDANAQDKDGVTPLLRAVKGKRHPMVKLLLERRFVDVNARDPSGRSSLWWAVCQCLDKIIQLLLERPDIDLEAGAPELCDSLQKRSPLEIARRRGYSSIATILEQRMRQKQGQ
ncbi:hypothetical protein A1O7_09474 [Cladophialophora yegresii CBS 114405]|uniref:Nephrocystin 3-like N-terminal domain-containing protein n=1 Tax=Cladophialophora yegresii CBS 114405 TaxID=1182544 RepID=W9VET7_9EURO|nr:uncharacterized protein A1O7_09474 [Cladophialophora yegresii CBS 114405]EXJ54137.1 hypothetical protein A1O7_09474 [Cladophialophora yegresii CBS 114405]